ncbi:hypothetical protein [Pseudochrobactrum kiredjianiae]|uniref:Uncharacterized protein n=1 Tax=Pseudochrobactrum kiredjianiae TaxID=386305 RepID=A0ABW3V4F0_9HYPH|nr:hypothetical protein [Pseudochrobactrum kiredjianiae]MDM7850968.1 hypothetical protein [Pseudochrobactrum kiredjianiae]
MGEDKALSVLLLVQFRQEKRMPFFLKLLCLVDLCSLGAAQNHPDAVIKAYLIRKMSVSFRDMLLI